MFVQFVGSFTISWNFANLLTQRLSSQSSANLSLANRGLSHCPPFVLSWFRVPEHKRFKFALFCRGLHCSLYRSIPGCLSSSCRLADVETYFSTFSSRLFSPAHDSSLRHTLYVSAIALHVLPVLSLQSLAWLLHEWKRKTK